MIPIQKKDAPLELLELKKQAAEEGLNPKEAYA